MEKESIDLFELQRLLRTGVEGLFPGKIWVRAEVSSVQVKSGGHCYLELCRNDSGRVLARAKAIIWRSNLTAVSSYLGNVTDNGLSAGMNALFKAQVSYSELYGMSLIVDAVEPLQTIGEAEMLRRRTIEKLSSLELMDKQKALSLPPLPCHLAVVSAAAAAGYGDFCKHLMGNPCGFAFEVVLFEAVMQGENAPSSISDALARIESSDKTFDAVLILRGGGSVQDLACFDDYGLCFSIAQCGIPVLTAIGHDRDMHIADMVAFDFEKTPTALADRFIDAFTVEDERLEAFGSKLRLAFASRLASMRSVIDVLEARIHGADPRNLLSKGYTIVTNDNGVILKSARSLRSGQKIKVMFEDGTIGATTD